THSEAAHKLKDEELVEICRDPDRPERNRLVLRKIHQHLSHEDYMRIRQNRKLQRFFGEKVPTTPQGFSQKKLRNFFGQRPPSELISLNLTEYFPGHNSEELERSHRMSMRRASRPSGPSRPKSRTISKLYDNESLSSSSSSFTLVPSVQGDDCSCHELPILEEERNNEFQVMEDEEVEENWNPDADTDSTDVLADSLVLHCCFADTSDLSPFKWIKGALIGSGSFGNVYLGLNSATGELMAVKQVELPTGQSSNEDRKKSMLDALQREITLLKELDHENIVRYLGSQHDEKSLNIFLEYVPGGSVSSMLRNYGPQEETLVRSFVRQILTGLNYLHERDIIHRDIKGANILVDNKGGIKISDFGISKKVEDEFMAATSAHRPSLQGSVFWMAPEVVKQTHYTTKADIWSLGCLIVEMFTGDHPFPTLHQMQAMFKIGLSCAPEIPDNISHDATDFLRLTFEADHVKRPPASVLQDHPFVTTTLKSSPQPSP
ncbi:6581_t:CDS:2, partial [Paraglomus occultum]